ncbi:MAG TPA: hypothetical protein VJ992_09690 [Gemmatimonadales bacterium]|nr:hypothetical protein [Gemmatimonadales bacterium]
MTQKLGMIEFFMMEAGEYLDRLDQIVSGSTPPKGEEFQRVARALRGAALMANQQPLAGAAGGLEHLARAVREGRRAWDDATKQLAIRGIDDLRILVRQSGNWGEAESAKAREIASVLGAAAGRPQPAERPSGARPDSGTRAFIAREGAALASALDRAAKMLEQNPQARDPLQAVLSAMQPLRGLASLADLPPMPDLLDGIEQAMAELTRSAQPHPDAGHVFETAARALARATREVAAEGRAAPDTDEVKTFATALRGLLSLDRAVVPIDAMFYDDGGPHVLERGTPPAGRARLGDVELVAHGEHFTQVADAIERAQTDTQRELRTHTLAGTFRALEGAPGTPIADAAISVVNACRQAIAAGLATAEPARFVSALREAGKVLSAAATEMEGVLAERLHAIARSLAGAPAAQPAAPAAVAAPPTPAAPAPPIAGEPAAPAAEPEAPTAVAEAPVPAETNDLAGSFLTFQRMVDSMGHEPASLDELLAGPPAAGATPAAPVRAAAPAHATETTLAPITDFCYSGRRALDRALELQDALSAAIQESRSADANDLLAEIFDLVRLGLDTDA